MKIKEYDFNILTQETTETERERTAQEIAERKAFEVQIAAQQAEVQAKATQKAALLDRLGITEAEARLLLG